MKRVFHLIPSLEIGGIETMMTRFVDSCPTDIPYTLVVFGGGVRTGIALTDAMRRRIILPGDVRLLRRIANMVRFIISHRADVIVSSTWKMSAMVFLARLCGWNGSHWSFTHRSSAAGPIDYLLRRWQVRHSQLCLADSAAAAKWIRRQGVKTPIEELRPIFRPPSVPARTSISQPVRICFVGRLAPVKNLPAIFALIESLASAALTVEFSVYGPDGGELPAVARWMKRSASQQLRCQYHGVVPPSRTWDILRNYDFIISCSHTEGFALSIAEAMQVGAVPIVGNIGGPAGYCNDSNAIVLRDYSRQEIYRAVRKIEDLVAHPLHHARKSAAARATFSQDEGFVGRYSMILRERAAETSVRGAKARG